MIQFSIIANVQGVNYLLTESGVFAGKSQTETLPYCPSDSEVWDLPFKTERLIWYFAMVLRIWNRPVGITEEQRPSIQLANQNAHYIGWKQAIK